MASRSAFADICPVCFETRPLKIVGRCKHSFCSECLFSFIGKQGDDVFSCPTCKVDFPRPWDGVDGLVGFTGEEVDITDLNDPDKDVIDLPGKAYKKKRQKKKKGQRGADGKPLQNRETFQNRETLNTNALDTRCKICLHKKKEEEAVSLCVQCGHLYICATCTKVHSKNPMTKGHVVVSLSSQKERELLCKSHDSPLNSYCHVCKEAVCIVCVMLEHSDHAVEEFGELVDTREKEVRVALNQRKARLSRLQKQMYELMRLKTEAAALDKQDTLIKEVDDHAEECIKEIVKWKEGMKTEIKDHYKVSPDITACLEEVLAAIQELQRPIGRAEKGLMKATNDEGYLHQLTALQTELKVTPETGVDIDGTGYIGRLKKLHETDCSFIPDENTPYFGELKYKSTQLSIHHPPDQEIIFEHTMRAEQEIVIPCIANLGQFFAVAHPTDEGEPSTAIDIYEFPGSLTCTLVDHVPPVYDMCATPDGNLAVLSDGTRGNNNCIKLFNPETGYINSTLDFNVGKPISFGVTIQHQYVVLSEDEEGEKQISIVEKDGKKKWTSLMKNVPTINDETSDEDNNSGTHDKNDKADIRDQINNASRIACGGRFIHVIGDQSVGEYEVMKTGIRRIKTYLSHYYEDPVDISATIWEELYFISLHYDTNDYTCFNFHKMDMCEDNKSIWNLNFHHLTTSIQDVRISARGGHIVMSQGLTITVLKEC